MLNRISKNPGVFLFNAENIAVIEAKHAAFVASLNLRNTIILYVIGLAMVFLAVVAAQSYLLILDPNAPQVNAQSFHLSTDKSGNTIIDYTFVAPVNGRPSFFTGNYVITADFARKLQGVRTLPIKYLANDPKVSRSALEDISMIDYRQPLVVIAVVVFCFAWATLRLIGFMRVMKLSRRYPGKLAQGKLTDIHAAPDGQLVVSYQYGLPFRKKHQGQFVTAASNTQPDLPTNGTPIWVLYQSQQQHQVL